MGSSPVDVSLYDAGLFAVSVGADINYPRIKENAGAACVQVAFNLEMPSVLMRADWLLVWWIPLSVTAGVPFALIGFTLFLISIKYQAK